MPRLPLLSSPPMRVCVGASSGAKTADEIAAADDATPITRKCVFPPFEVPYIPLDASSAPGGRINTGRPAGRILFWLEKGEPHDEFAPAEQAAFRDGLIIGTAYDSNGHWWIVEWGPHGGRGSFCSGSHFGVEFLGCVAKFQGCYKFTRLSGRPDYAAHEASFLEKVNTFVEKTIVPVAIAIATVINPGVGIAAGIVYAGVERIVSGAKLTNAVMATAIEGVKAEFGSVTASRYFEQGVSLVQSGFSSVEIERQRALIQREFGGSAAIVKSLETGIGIAQAQLIQSDAIGSIRKKLTLSQQQTADTALSYGASLTDVMIGFYGDAQGIRNLNSEIRQATSKVAPNVASAGASGGGGGSGGSSGIGTVVTLALLGGGGYLAAKYGRHLLERKKR